MNDVLIKLLAQSSIYAPFFQGGFSSHLTMTLIALDNLGAQDDIKRMYFDDCIKKLELNREKSIEINRDNFDDFLGLATHFPAYLDFIEYEVKDMGVEKTIELYFDKLSPGIGAAAFHALIRLGYAIGLPSECGTVAKKEIAISIAYLATAYLPLHNLKECSAQSVRERLAYIRRNFTPDPEFIGEGLILQRMRSASYHPQFDSLVGRIKLDNDGLHDLADFVIKLYCETYDFSALHAVTATHALRLILPYVKDQDKIINNYWTALVALYFSIRAPKVDLDKIISDEQIGLFQWDEIIKSAIRSRDEHTIKFVYSCHEEFIHYRGGAHYIKAAAVKAGMYSLMKTERCLFYNPLLFGPEIDAIDNDSSAPLENKKTATTGLK